METIISGAPPQNGGDVIKDSNAASFEADVLAASAETPVIVDFWAPWCGPCKELTPAIERVVRAAGGKVRLVKINVDENQELAGQLRVQSIPSVFAFKDGRPVDAFVGALPESQVKAFVDKLMGGAQGPSPVEQAMAQADAAFDAGEHDAAANIYGQIVGHDPNIVGARAGLIRCAVATGDLAGARRALDDLPEEIAGNAAFTAARTALELAEQAEGAGDTAVLVLRLEQNENDHEARYDLALALYAAGNASEAIDQLLEIVRRDRGWNDEAARKQLLKLFEALGPTHELTVGGRRQLSSMLFS